MIKRIVPIVLALFGLGTVIWAIRRRFISLETENTEQPTFRVVPTPSEVVSSQPKGEEEEISEPPAVGTTISKPASATSSPSNAPSPSDASATSAASREENANSNMESIQPLKEEATTPIAEPPTTEPDPGSSVISASSSTGISNIGGLAFNGEDPLLQVRGIGVTFAQRLRDIGIASLQDLAQTSPTQLAESLDITLERAMNWVRRALEQATQTNAPIPDNQ